MKKVFTLLGLLFCLTGPLLAADEGIFWQVKADRVDASIKDWDLAKLLEKMAAQTSWQIFVEPGTSDKVSVKFKGLTSDDALSKLLGNINYSRAVTNGTTQLFVFKTDVHAATQLVQAGKSTNDSRSHLIPNELVIKLKPGSKRSIEELARLVNGKIVGRDDKYSLYRLQFADEAAAIAAREFLNRLTDDVAAVTANYTVDRPTLPQPPALTGTATDSLLHPTTPPNGKLLVGLLDTGVQSTEYDRYIEGKVNFLGATANSPDGQPTHGTSMLETLVNSMADAPSKVLVSDMYEGQGETTTTYEMVTHLIDLIDRGAKLVNISAGGTEDSPFLGQVIAEALQKNIVIVAAAGNQGGTGNTYPAAYPGVIGVTAVNPNGTLASYADHGPFVSAAATGEMIVSLGNQAWDVMGTSVSSAVIAGKIAEVVNDRHVTVQQAANTVMSSYSARRIR